MRRWFWLAVVAVAVVGCRGAHRGSGEPGVLRYPMVAEPTTLDPARVSDLYTSELLQNVFECLVTFDAGGQVVPCLAERWEVSADGRTYTFHLRGSAAFHNGRPLIADDVKYSLERALRPATASPSAANYLAEVVGAPDVASGRRRDLAGVHIVDPHTLSISLRRPCGYFLGEIGYTSNSVVCREAIERSGGRVDERAAVGTGPYELSEYRSGARIVLTANPKYWGGRPRLTRIERPIVLDPSTAHVMYESGQVDTTLISRSDYVADRANPGVRDQAQLLPTATVVYVVMHRGLEPAFADIRVRQAIARAIDRDQMMRIATGGVWLRADSLLPPGLPGATPGTQAYPYAPAEAARLLADAGHPRGRGLPRLRLVYVQKTPELSAAAEVIRDDLRRNLGITVDLEERESATFLADTNAEKVAFYITAWIADYLDPQDFLSTLLRSGAPLNHTGYRSAAFDALCDRADALPSMAERVPLYRQADRVAMADMAVLPLAFDRQPVLIKPYVGGWRSNPTMFALPHTNTTCRR